MLSSKDFATNDNSISTDVNLVADKTKNDIELNVSFDAVPLVSELAVGGFSGVDFSIPEGSVKNYYNLPKLHGRNVDFLIEVTGHSMEPHIYSGDIIACSVMHDSAFIQWGKPYLISTREDGLIVKRLRKSDSMDSLLAVSDNPDYDPFTIPKSEITGLARVICTIHIE